jgi:hypothetical protein
MTALTYDLSFEAALTELQAALGRSVNVMIRPRDPAAHPQVLAHMSGRLMRAESKYAGLASDAARAAQGESLFFCVVPLGIEELTGYDGFYVTEHQFGGAMSVSGERADRLHVRVGEFELLIAIARVAAPDDDERDEETETNY